MRGSSRSASATSTGEAPSTSIPHVQPNPQNHSPTSTGRTCLPIVLKGPEIWSQNLRVETLPTFAEKSGSSVIFRDISNPSPYRICCELFRNEMVEHISFHTNLYATQKGKPFIPTTENEVRLFLGINLFTSVKKLPSYRDYWSSSLDLHDSYISDLMTVKRFSFLLSHTHANDNSLMPKRGEANFDKLHKIKPLVEMLNKKFAKCHRPHQKVALDESMLKFKGFTATNSASVSFLASTNLVNLLFSASNLAKISLQFDFAPQVS
jgi:hypothetical protein